MNEVCSIVFVETIVEQTFVLFFWEYVCSLVFVLREGLQLNYRTVYSYEAMSSFFLTFVIWSND